MYFNIIYGKNFQTFPLILGTVEICKEDGEPGSCHGEYPCSKCVCVCVCVCVCCSMLVLQARSTSTEVGRACKTSSMCVCVCVCVCLFAVLNQSVIVTL